MFQQMVRKSLRAKIRIRINNAYSFLRCCDWRVSYNKKSSLLKFVYSLLTPPVYLYIRTFTYAIIIYFKYPSLSVIISIRYFFHLSEVIHVRKLTHFLKITNINMRSGYLVIVNVTGKCITSDIKTFYAVMSILIIGK